MHTINIVPTGICKCCGANRPLVVSLCRPCFRKLQHLITLRTFTDSRTTTDAPKAA